MTVRYHAVQFCLRNGGWTTLPLLGGTQQHAMNRIMKKVSDLRPHYSLRVWRMTKGWEPDVFNGTEEDAIIASIDTMDRASRDEINKQAGWVSSPVPPAAPAKQNNETEARDSIGRVGASLCAGKLVQNESTKYAITTEAIETVVGEYVVRNREMMGTFIRMAARQGLADKLLENSEPTDWARKDQESSAELVKQVSSLLVTQYRYEEIDGILYPENT